MIYQHVTFQNHRGYHIAGVFSAPEGETELPCVIFAHGWDSGKDSPRTVPLSEALAAEGISSVRIDLTGHGDSEGTKEESTAEQQTDDVLCSLRCIKRLPHVDPSRVGLHGASFGAIAAVQAASEFKGARAVVLRGPRTDGLEAAARSLAVPILVILGENDPLAGASQLFLEQVQSEKQLVLLPGAGHLFDQTPEHLRQSIDITVAWFKRWLIDGGSSD